MKRLKLVRWIETKRAPRQPASYGGSYVPSGIDIYTTDDPALVRIGKFDREMYRVADLVAALDELDHYESRKKLPGEKIEAEVEVVLPESDKGNVYHRASSLRATPHPEHEGLIQLHETGGMGGGVIHTAERNSLREALENRVVLAKLEAEDQERYPTEEVKASGDDVPK